jgi:hypothetical protein
MRLDSSGNLGLGVTPSAWDGYTALELPFSAAFVSATNQSQSVLNTFYNGTNWLYKNSNFASRYVQSSGQHLWLTAPSGTAGASVSWTQAMSLTADGFLLVGKTTADITVVGFEARGNGDAKFTRSGSTSATTTLEVYSTGASAYRFYVDMAGTVNATSIVISAISDQRLKENVRDIDTGLNAIMSLKPRRFDWKEGKGQDKKNVAGFIAQEFEEVFPECVGATKAGADGIEYKNINHETLIPTLVKAIQEQQAIINSLKARLDAANL